MKPIMTFADILKNSAEDGTKISRSLVRLIDCYDGDTITVALECTDFQLKIKCRLRGIDTPELPSSEGYISRDSLLCILTGQVTKGWDRKHIKKYLLDNEHFIWVKFFGEDKYGRMLTEIYLNNTTVNNIMIERGYASKYVSKVTNT